MRAGLGLLGRSRVRPEGAFLVLDPSLRGVRWTLPPSRKALALLDDSNLKTMRSWPVLLKAKAGPRYEPWSNVPYTEYKT